MNVEILRGIKTRQKILERKEEASRIKNVIAST